MKKKVLYRSVAIIEVLSEEPIPAEMSLDEIMDECNCGSYSGIHEWKTKNKKIVGKRAATFTTKQGSDVGFFDMDENGNDLSDEDNMYDYEDDEN